MSGDNLNSNKKFNWTVDYLNEQKKEFSKNQGLALKFTFFFLSVKYMTYF